jgi:hypothetical protein
LNYYNRITFIPKEGDAHFYDLEEKKVWGENVQEENWDPTAPIGPLGASVNIIYVTYILYVAPSTIYSTTL